MHCLLREPLRTQSFPSSAIINLFVHPQVLLQMTIKAVRSMTKTEKENVHIQNPEGTFRFLYAPCLDIHNCYCSAVSYQTDRRGHIGTTPMRMLLLPLLHPPIRTGVIFLPLTHSARSAAKQRESLHCIFLSDRPDSVLILHTSAMCRCSS